MADDISEVTVDVSVDAEQGRVMESISTQVTLAALKQHAGRVLTFHAAGMTGGCMAGLI